MSFPYTINVPASGNNPSDDQPDMQQNTNTLANMLNVDLYGPNQALSGQHQKVTFPQALSPTPTPGVGEGVIYPTVDSYGNGQFSFINEFNTGVALTRGFVGPGPSSIPAPQIGANGWTFLPGGLILVWGSVTLPGAGLGVWQQTFTYGITFANVFSVTLGPRTTNTFEASVQAPGNTSVVVTGNLGGQVVYIMVLGN